MSERRGRRECPCGLNGPWRGNRQGELPAEVWRHGSLQWGTFLACSAERSERSVSGDRPVSLSAPSGEKALLVSTEPGGEEEALSYTGRARASSAASLQERAEMENW